MAVAAAVVDILTVRGLSTWVRSICGWQHEATRLYITMSVPFTVSRLQGWSFCEASEKGKRHCGHWGEDLFLRGFLGT